MSENHTILIVDDEQDVLTYLQTLFEDHGFKTVTATNGIEAMEVVAATQPDLITLDITMPEQSGVKTYRNLKDNAAFAHIPVVVITALGETQYNFMGTRRQVPKPEGFMAKPIDHQELIKIVSDLLEQ